MTIDNILRAIDKQNILGFRRPETVIQKIRDTVDDKVRIDGRVSNLIELSIQGIDGRVKILLSNYIDSNTYYIAQYEIDRNKGEVQ